MGGGIVGGVNGGRRGGIGGTTVHINKLNGNSKRLIWGLKLQVPLHIWHLQILHLNYTCV